MTQEQKQILIDSDEAAQFRTNISGWVSRHGRFFGNDERAARFDGCTHVICEDCGEPSDKGWLVCLSCRDKRDAVRYQAMPSEVWDGKGLIYSDATDEYFPSWDDVDDYCYDHDITVEDLRLMICEGQYLPLLDVDDYGCDVLAEDGELPDEAIEAIEKFNETIKKIGVVSWYPCDKRALQAIP
jgi:hypothetical protein